MPIVDGLASGTINAIATDHAPHPGSEKMQEFERCPFGIIGLETAIALALEELVAPGKITLARLVELFTTGPESVMRLGRGTLAPGAPGDVTVFSTDVEWTYDVNQSASRSRNSPFHGQDVPRRPDGHGSGRRGQVAAVGSDLQVVWSKACLFGDLGKCSRTDLFAVVETECEIRPPGTLKLSMRSDLFLKCPSNT